MSPVTRVLVVEDHPTVAEALVFLLDREGFQALPAGDGATALAVFDDHGADVVLLDVELPGDDGFAVCRALRARSQVPIIMVTARDSELDTVLALELGADDYLPKPYASAELVARIRAVLRRAPGREATAADHVDHGGETLEVGPIHLDVDRHRVTVHDQQVALPLREFQLLAYLMAHPGRVLTRHQILDRVWGADFTGDGKTLDVHIKRLRQKIEPDPAHPTQLVTVRGLGYQLHHTPGGRPTAR